jgi:type IV pilus assembly protein PilN
MIEINLLPHREAKRAADLRETFKVFVLGAVLTAGAIYMADRGVRTKIASAEVSVRQLEANIEQFRPQQKQVVAFKKKKKELRLKLDVITSLDRARSGPLRLLDELSLRTPERLWLTQLQTKGMAVTIEGESLDTGVVADFLRSLNESSYFVEVDLDRTSRGKVIQGVKVVKFAIRARMTNAAVSEEKSATPDETA